MGDNTRRSFPPSPSPLVSFSLTFAPFFPFSFSTHPSFPGAPSFSVLRRLHSSRSRFCWRKGERRLEASFLFFLPIPTNPLSPPSVFAYFHDRENGTPQSWKCFSTARRLSETESKHLLIRRSASPTKSSCRFPPFFKLLPLKVPFRWPASVSTLLFYCHLYWRFRE